MKVHRFYTPDVSLDKNIWVRDSGLLKQWLKVLRFRLGQQVVLFDGKQRDRLYKIIEINSNEVNLEMVTDFEPKLPKRDIYLFWSVLKKDKNEWIAQKTTELGVSHLVPLIASRSEKTNVNIDRLRKISIEATEQCGRSDIVSIREPLTVEKALEQYAGKLDMFVCEQGASSLNEVDSSTSPDNPLGLLVGPEGGWTESELEMFDERGIKKFGLHDFTLRAETAAISAVAVMMQ